MFLIQEAWIIVHWTQGTGFYFQHTHIQNIMTSKWVLLGVF
jgi:hypothetical protein